MNPSFVWQMLVAENIGRVRAIPALGSFKERRWITVTDTRLVASVLHKHKGRNLSYVALGALGGANKMTGRNDADDTIHVSTLIAGSTYPVYFNQPCPTLSAAADLQVLPWMQSA